MPAWSLPGPILLMLTAPAGGDRDASPARQPVLIVDAAAPAGRPNPIVSRFRLVPATEMVSVHDRRFDRLPGATLRAVHDPQADCVTALLRDRRAKRGGVDARVEWRLSGAGSDVGLGGGLARVLDTLLHD